MSCSSPELVIEPFYELSDEDSDDDRRILANDLRTREKRSYEYEWNVLNASQLHTSNARKLAAREAEWLMPISEMDVCQGQGHDPIRIRFPKTALSDPLLKDFYEFKESRITHFQFFFIVVLPFPRPRCSQLGMTRRSRCLFDT